MRRREFLCGLVVQTAAWPIAAQQPRRIARIGILKLLRCAIFAGDRVYRIAAGTRLRRGSKPQDNSSLGRRSIESSAVVAAELVASKIDVMIALGPATWAAKRRQAGSDCDHVQRRSGRNGLVSNLARPGGNITGFSYMSTDLASKRLELMHQFDPARS